MPTITDSELYLLPKNSRVFHIYSAEFPPVSFNDSGKGDNRFSPIFDAKSQVIPTFYVADNFIDVMAETIMRKQIGNERRFTGNIHQQGLVHLDLNRQLKLVDLTRFDAIAPLLHKGKEAYPQLRTVATWAAVNTASDIHGLTWYGYQRGIQGHRCFVLFGDRLKPTDFDIRINEFLNTPIALQKLRDAALALDCAIPTALI